MFGPTRCRPSLLPPADSATEQLVGLLRLRHPELLRSPRSIVEFPDHYQTDVWSDAEVVDGVSERAVFINGLRWLVISPSPGVRPRVLPRAPDEEWRIRPAFREEWASFSCIGGEQHGQRHLDVDARSPR